MNKYLTAVAFVIMSIAFVACSTDNNPEQNAGEMKAVEMVDIAAEKEAVIAIMKSYKDAVQNLTVEGTMELFTKEATVFESGGVEGTYENYVAHHLGPELDYFNSFEFSDYKIDADIDLPFAFTTETYIYIIDLKADEETGREGRIIKKKGVATSVLKKIDGEWKITQTHSSSRAVKDSSH